VQAHSLNDFLLIRDFVTEYLDATRRNNNSPLSKVFILHFEEMDGHSLNDFLLLRDVVTECLDAKHVNEAL
jgi:hypothetical protein